MFLVVEEKSRTVTVKRFFFFIIIIFMQWESDALAKEKPSMARRVTKTNGQTGQIIANKLFKWQLIEIQHSNKLQYYSTL